MDLRVFSFECSEVLSLASFVLELRIDYPLSI